MRDESNSFIKLHRKFLSWEWYDDPATKSVFIHLLLIASWKDAKWRGIELKAGELIRTNDNLAKELKMSVQSVKTAISHLQSTGELTCRKVGRIRIITVKNWGRYQTANLISTASSTDQQPNSNLKPTAYKEYKELKNSNKYMPPAKIDIETYADLRGFKNVDVDAFIDYNESLGWKMEWHRALDQWVKNEDRKRAGNRSRNEFLNMTQRDYDFDAIERMLEDDEYTEDLERVY